MKRFTLLRQLAALPVLFLFVFGCSIETPDVHIRRAEADVEKARFETQARETESRREHEQRMAEVAARETESRLEHEQRMAEIASREKIEIETADARSHALLALASIISVIAIVIGVVGLQISRMHYHNENAKMVMAQRQRALEIKARHDELMLQAMMEERRMRWAALAVRRANENLIES